MKMPPERETGKLQVLIEQDEEGLYHASCIGLNGCYASGDSYMEAIVDIREKIEATLEWLRDKNGHALDVRLPEVVWCGKSM